VNWPSIEEALNSITINAAYVINRQREVESISLGKKMDLLLLDSPDACLRVFAFCTGSVFKGLFVREKNGKLCRSDI